MKRIQLGPFNKVLEVDLSSETYSIYIVDDQERAMYLGGKGLGLKLIYDRLEPGTDPLGKDNILAIMPGVLMGTGAICSGRFAAVTKSPLTGIMVSSSCGGPFGMALKTAGWDGLLIKGKANRPTYIELNEQGVVFTMQKVYGGVILMRGKKTGHKTICLSNYWPCRRKSGVICKHRIRQSFFWAGRNWGG